MLRYLVYRIHTCAIVLICLKWDLSKTIILNQGRGNKCCTGGWWDSILGNSRHMRPYWIEAVFTISLQTMTSWILLIAAFVAEGSKVKSNKGPWKEEIYLNINEILLQLVRIKWTSIDTTNDVYSFSLQLWQLRMKTHYVIHPWQKLKNETSLLHK